MNAPEAERSEAQPEHSPGGGEDSYLDEVLHEDLPAAGPECAAHAGDCRGIEELGQQNSHRVEQAHGKKGEGDADEHAVVVLNDALVFEPLSDIGEPVISRTLEPSGLALLRPISIQQ